jgi:DNA-binding LytR/AlgR family response regulator
MISSDPLLFRVYDELINISPKELICCKADEDWTVFVLSGNREYQVNKPLYKIWDRLPAKHFERVHKEWIVNIHYIKQVLWEEQILILADETQVPILPILRMRMQNILKKNPVFFRKMEWMV